jgi:hypothetical protein
MSKTVTFQGKDYEFPDSATDEQISKALQSESKGGQFKHTSPVGESVNRAIRNFPGSLGQVIKDVAIGLPQVAWKLGNEPITGHTPEDISNFAKEVGQVYKRRFWDEPQKTFEEDPAGMMSDVSSLFGLGGGLARAGGLSRAAGALGRVSRATDPIQGVTRALGAVSAPARQAVGEATYRHALGYLPKPIQETRRDLAKTGISHQTPLSEKGLAKIDVLQKDLYPKIQGIIDRLEEAGSTVDQRAVIQELSSVVDDFKTVAPSADVKAIKETLQDFVRNYGTQSFIEREVPLASRGSGYRPGAGDIPYKAGPQGQPPFWWMDIDETEQLTRPYPTGLPSADKSTPGASFVGEPPRLASGRELPPAGQEFPRLIKGPSQSQVPVEPEIVSPSGRAQTRTETYRGPMVPGQMSPQAAQDVKINTYRKTGDRSYVIEQDTARVESMKALARGLKNQLEIEAKKLGIPNLGELNKEYGDLTALEDVIKTNPVDTERTAANVIAGTPYSTAYGLARIFHAPQAMSNIGIGIAPGPWRSSIPPFLLKSASPGGLPGRVKRESKRR